MRNIASGLEILAVGAEMTTTLAAKGSAAVAFQGDHGSGSCLGLATAIRRPRFAAVHPLRAKRHASPYVGDHLRRGLDFLDLDGSPAVVCEPEGQRCIERSIRVFQEKLEGLRRFDTFENLPRTPRVRKDPQPALDSRAPRLSNTRSTRADGADGPSGARNPARWRNAGNRL